MTNILQLFLFRKYKQSSSTDSTETFNYDNPYQHFMNVVNGQIKITFVDWCRLLLKTKTECLNNNNFPATSTREYDAQFKNSGKKITTVATTINRQSVNITSVINCNKLLHRPIITHSEVVNCSLKPRF